MKNITSQVLDNRPEKIYDCKCDESPLLKYGDIFTITPDRSEKNHSMVLNQDGSLKKFRAVP